LSGKLTCTKGTPVNQDELRRRLHQGSPNNSKQGNATPKFKERKEEGFACLEMGQLLPKGIRPKDPEPQPKRPDQGGADPDDEDF
jgi:hypothetical protein